MANKKRNNIGLTLLENNRLRLILDENEAILFELRSAENGAMPFRNQGFSTELEITNKNEQQYIIKLATEFASSHLGVQSLFYREKNGYVVNYESCFIDFIDGFVSKDELITRIDTLSQVDSNFIEKIKSYMCTQIQISFPIISSYYDDD